MIRKLQIISFDFLEIFNDMILKIMLQTSYSIIFISIILVAKGMYELDTNSIIMGLLTSTVMVWINKNLQGGK